MNENLTREVSEVEVKSAVFQFRGSKVPRPDSFSGLFCQKNWKIVSPGVFTVVKAFLKTCTFLSSLNQTDITLILKISNPTHAFEFRPINLCNFVYKVIIKVFVNILKMYLSHLITPFQSAFLAGRLIQDSIMVTHEVFHHLKSRSKVNKVKCVLKLDM